MVSTRAQRAAVLQASAAAAGGGDSSPKSPSLKDLLLVMSPAILSDPVTSLALDGLLYASYPILTAIALPYTDNSSNIIDVLRSFLIPLCMLMTTNFGCADSPGYRI